MKYINSNLVGFTNLLECVRNSNIKKFMYASSSSVYGMNKKTPFSTEDSVDKPISIYAATKKSNELIAHTYSYFNGIETIGLRFFTYVFMGLGEDQIWLCFYLQIQLLIISQ